MHDVPFLEKDRLAGEALCREKKIGHLLFSEGTYQIEVKDKEGYFPFLQIDDEGKLLDFFCTCSAAEKKKSCPHLAAAYICIFGDNLKPLHIRFKESLWNQLCQLASRRHGYDTQNLKPDIGGGYQAASVTGRRLFFVKPLNKAGQEKLGEILNNRPFETEETSIKFSKLSLEELTLWKEGRPSHSLRYELSFWSDLAKWWMLLYEQKEPCEIEFHYEKDPLPKAISIRFPQVEIGFYIAAVNWGTLIPALASIKSPLSVYEFHEQKIEKITYDPKERALNIDFSSLENKIELPEMEGYEVGEWLFVKDKGFYPAKLDPLLLHRHIPAQTIGTLLQRHAKFVQKYLVGANINEGSIKANYHLFFDASRALHIQCYVFEVGDLQHSDSASFGSWVYLQGKGFYQLENLLFEEIEKTIPKEKVSDFVNRHRLWLHSYEGFQTHVSSVEAHLVYSMTDDGLRFDTPLEISEEGGEIFDFGDWIYVKGRGFYAKTSSRTRLRPGLALPPKEISSFIRSHREELEHLTGFFRSHCPLKKTGLNISLNEQGRIVVKPVYIYEEKFEKNRKIYGDFIYVEKEGFCEISPELRLPEDYSQEVVISKQAELHFVTFDIEALRPFILEVDPRLSRPKDLVLQIERLKKDEKTKGGRWIAQLSYQSEIGKIEAFEVWSGLHEKKLYLFSNAGLVHLTLARFHWLKALSKKRWLSKGKNVRLTTMELLRLQIFEEIRDPTGESSAEIESRKLLEDLKAFHTGEPPPLEGLKSMLRPYQEIGVKWLWFLYINGLSGLLCDEMGLGKTHQAMALLAAAHNSQEGLTQKYLVVCPTSVIYHWQELLKKFLPSMRVYVFYGAQRDLSTFSEEFDLLLTSYGTLRSEKKALSELSFEIGIFDEIQIAKNIRSQTHKALRVMHAEMRLGLTGTPIENRLLELKALFDVVVPSYLPNESVFKELFINPIERHQDAEKKSLLSKFIKPFILRRKKSDVLLELPEKIEEISYCDLSEEQHALYKDTFLHYRESILQQIKDENQTLPYVHIFALFSRLKQICDHPCLINKKIDDYKKHASGKWDLFVELLQETRESGQKLVVFSQYLDMLDIIEMYLKENKIGFAGIRGSTRDRREQLVRFREDPTCEVFVASLQAAGVGIDLVAASVVIHYDRWWNPARENQATDRVHRIGQSRGVQVFKMVAKDTIEEHIHRMIEKKLELMEGVIGFDEHDQIKGLDRKELLEIMQQLGQDIEEKPSQNHPIK